MTGSVYFSLAMLGHIRSYVLALHTTNTFENHIIMASDLRVQRALDACRRGDIVTSRGMLGELKADPEVGHQARILLCEAPSGVVTPDDVAWLRPLAEEGVAVAETAMGWCLEFGVRGLSVNLEESLQWYRLAAERGDPLAVYFIGWVYHTGFGSTQPDKELAVEHFRRAADMGNVRAMAMLGSMYLKGYGMEKDEVEALNLFRMSSAAGWSAGHEGLSYMHRFGLGGLPQDEQKARQLLQLADMVGYNTFLMYGFQDLGARVLPGYYIRAS